MPTTQCFERDACLALRGQPIGMYHCPHCGEMVIAGLDPTPTCPRISTKSELKEVDRVRCSQCKQPFEDPLRHTGVCGREIEGRMCIGLAERY